MKSNKYFLTIFASLIFSFSYSQKIEKGYFMFPIKPGQQNELSANMGELRPNHFHGGLDIKTDRKTGYPIYASAEGYVSRIRASSYGYGFAVYITHPNHLVTVYAHLEKFNKAIGDYILQKQYEQQTFEIEVRPAKGELPVKKGEVIGLAGNSGGSQAPHLHFEIRDTTDRVLNPAECRFEEIKDNLPPVFDRIALVPFETDSRINGEFDRKEFSVSHNGSHYVIPGKISASGLIALELKAYDKKNFAHNIYGVQHMKVLIDGEEIFSHHLNSFTFDETRYINEHVNYPVYVQTGRRFEKLYISDGNRLSTYKAKGPLKGRFIINSGQSRKVKIVIEDDYGNQSSLAFDIHHSGTASGTVASTTLPVQILKTEISENILKVSVKCPGDPGVFLYSKNSALQLSSSYAINGYTTYLYDLRKGLPDSVKAGNQKEVFKFVQPVLPGNDQKLTFNNISLSFPPGCLADTLYLQLDKDLDNRGIFYQIHDRSICLYDTLCISIDSEEHATEGCLAYCTNRGKPDCEGGSWNDNKIEIKTRNLGKFTILKDTVKPTIRYISNFGNSVKFTVFDDLSGIQSWKASLNSYWLLMNYDHKRNLMWSERLDKTVPLKGELIFEVTDRAGNIETIKMTL